MRRHLAWILWLVGALASYVLLAFLTAFLSDRAVRGDEESLTWALLTLLSLAVQFALPFVMLCISAACARSCFRRWRRSRGRYTRLERSIIDRQERSAEWWRYAGAQRQLLLDGRVPEARESWEVVLQNGERLFEDVTLGYARYYGADVQYTQTSSFAFGHPAFVLSAIAVNAAANAASARRASLAAAPQWREHQTARVLITNRRFLVHANGRWLSFWFEGITAIYPETAVRTLICQFEVGEPLMLTGDAAPLASVYAVLIALGPEALERHPALAALNMPASAPELPPIGRERRKRR
ncbi:hypothetical protein [Leucobacter ruminantium]|uniref:Uncharacterized protein n=1 Tax=Leucobacter ruminantium TaxID=1289170 RepID=A0A939LZB3_9MICO|nr:hypothetical protein [Leucobacter ruminantium]MBO1805693.1 hypothetical protein [Leucobacter ruminantium]